jgi:hypothetical protein
VLSDYTSSSIDLNDPRVYRDLSKPMGALSPARAEMAADRYDALCNAGNVVEFEQPSDSEPQLPPFHFGTKVKSSCHVYHGLAYVYFLILKQVHTTHRLELHCSICCALNRSRQCR